MAAAEWEGERERKPEGGRADTLALLPLVKRQVFFADGEEGMRQRVGSGRGGERERGRGRKARGRVGEQAGREGGRERATGT